MSDIEFSCSDSNFIIQREDEAKALSFLKQANEKSSFYGDQDEDLSEKEFNNEFRKASTLDDLFWLFGWEVERNGDGIAKLFYEGRPLHDYEMFFSAIARFVQPDSYLAIEWAGEDAEEEIWTFEKGILKKGPA